MGFIIQVFGKDMDAFELPIGASNLVKLIKADASTQVQESRSA